MENAGFLTKQGRSGAPRKDGERYGGGRMRNVDAGTGGNSGNWRNQVLGQLVEDDSDLDMDFGGDE